jgi:gliding motility-associated-like protein
LPELIASKDYGDTVYFDHIEEYAWEQIEGNFCYFVEAVEGDSNPIGVKGLSRSNVCCTSQFPRIFIPNAFTPDNDGINDIFQPYISFASPQDYTFAIYNRWGEKIFETNNSQEGWDGNINKVKEGIYIYHLVKEGIYIYHISFSTAENEFYERCGYINLLRP